MKRYEDTGNLAQHIEQIRKTLYKTGLLKGINHEETMKVSKELDELISAYQTNRN